MRRGWVLCTHILCRVILLHLIPQMRHTPQAAKTDEARSELPGIRTKGERQGGCLMIKNDHHLFIEIFSYDVT